MSHNNHLRVLVVGIDAAERTLVRQLIDQDRMPTLKRLLAQGRWSSVESPAHLGSSAVWPTFMTGQEASAHGIYGEWIWQPETMSLQRFSGQGLTPFWKALVGAGVKVGVLDIPFAPLVKLSEGFELAEWGPHDSVQGHVQILPSRIAGLVSSETTAHPFSLDRHNMAEPHDHETLMKLTSACLAGVRLRGELAERLIEGTRPDLAIINFTELHHCGHHLWHTIAPQHEAYRRQEFSKLPPLKPSLEEVYGEVDSQIERLIEIAGKEATVMVFSLHGMGPAHGVPAFLGPLLCELGFARLADWTTKSWSGRARSLMAGIKRRAPIGIKKLYYKTSPLSTVHRLARQTMLPEYDWSQTRAFSLPTDQHGWIRVNLRGREAAGIVPLSEYEGTCRRLEELLRALTASDGSALVSDVIRTARRAEHALSLRLPDLVIHWHAAAFAAPVKIKNTAVEAYPIGRKFTGAHEPEGFLISTGRLDLPAGEAIRAGDMHRLIRQALNNLETQLPEERPRHLAN